MNSTGEGWHMKFDVGTLLKEYGLDSVWSAIGDEGNYFLDELNAELSEIHPLYARTEYAAARCLISDDVLFLLKDRNWAIVHLTYTRHNTDGFPMFKLFSDLHSAMRYMKETD